MYRSISQLERQQRHQKIAAWTFIIFMSILVFLVWKTPKSVFTSNEEKSNRSMIVQRS